MPLREFWAKQPRSKAQLREWFHTTEKAKWNKFEDVKAVYCSADRVGKFTVFDIGGNKWRIITAIHYNRQMIFVRYVLTHAEYDKGKWKDD